MVLVTAMAVAALILAGIDVVRSRGEALTAWATALLAAALIWGR